MFSSMPVASTRLAKRCAAVFMSLVFTMRVVAFVGSAMPYVASKVLSSYSSVTSSTLTSWPTTLQNLEAFCWASCSFSSSLCGSSSSEQEVTVMPRLSTIAVASIQQQTFSFIDSWFYKKNYCVYANNIMGAKIYNHLQYAKLFFVFLC